MQKQEFLELFEAAIRAAKSARDDDRKNSPEVTRCIDALNRLKKAPESLACDVVTTTSIGNRLTLLIGHKNSWIGSESKRLYYFWLKMLYASGRTQSRSRESPGKIPMAKTGDLKRDKVREILQTSLAKVVTEVVHDSEMKKRVIACDPLTVAESVESTMFEKLGCFVGPQKAKYRSILFNIGDSKNPDLRRKVLIGEINGEKLVTMERQEMGSEKIQMEVQHFKEKSKLREENRMKIMMLQSDMIMT